MGLFEFILILVLIISITEIVTKIGVPLAKRLGDRFGSAPEDRRRLDEALRAAAIPAETIEELEQRLARIEDRLAFLEELRASPDPARLTQGPDPRDR